MQRWLTRLGLTGLATLVLPATALAQGIPGLNQSPKQTDLHDIVDILVYIIKFGLGFAAAIGALFIIVSGYQYVLAAGNPEKLEKAKMGLTWAITGFILSISAYAIVLLLQNVLGARQKVSDNRIGFQPDGPNQAATVLEQLIQVSLTFAGAVSILFLILGGYRYVTSQGNQDLAESAKRTVTYAVIGLIVSMTAFLIFELTRTTIT